MVDPASYEARLGGIRIGLRSDLELSRILLHDRPGYVVHDPLSFANHKFTAEEYRVLGAIRPSRSLKECFESLVERDILDDSDREVFYGFVLTLHSKNLLALPIIDAAKLFERAQKRQAARRKSWLSALLYFQVPLWDPDRFLARTQRYVGFLFSRIGIAIWLGLAALVTWKLWGRLDELFETTSVIFEISNIPILYLGLVALKGLHELGHAYTCRRFGGAVPEIGAAFIVATPCAYVDASSAWRLPSKWSRIAVSMGGIYVETMIALIFSLVWAGSAPGLLRDVATNIIVLASVTTLLFNLNPLMKFDGYYVFSDLVGVPNLRQKGRQLVAGFAKAVFLGVPSEASQDTLRERFLLSCYGVASFLYRIVLAFSITMMVMFRWPLAGALMGLFFAFLLIVQPLLRLVGWLWWSRDTAEIRTRARLVSAAALVALPVLVSVTPVSFNVVATGMLEPERRIVVRAPADGFLAEVTARQGEQVGARTPICRLENHDLALAAVIAREDLVEFDAKLEASEGIDPSEASKYRPSAEFLKVRAADAEARAASLLVRAESTAVVASGAPEEMLGRHFSKGDPVLELHAGKTYVRVVLSSNDFDRSKVGEGSVAELRWSVDPSRTVRAVVREVRPTATKEDLPLALTTLAGGDVHAARTQSGHARGSEPYVHVLLEPAWVPVAATQGLRATVRLEARVVFLGGWLRRKLSDFSNAWKAI